MPTPKKFCIRNWSVKNKFGTFHLHMKGHVENHCKLLRVIDGPSQPNPLTLVDIFNAINLYLLNVVANIHQSPNHHKDLKLPGNKYCLIIITVINLTGRNL